MTKETLFGAYVKDSGVNLGDPDKFFANLSASGVRGWEAMARVANEEIALKTLELTKEVASLTEQKALIESNLADAEAEIVRLNAEIASKTSTANQTVDSLETPEGLLDQAIELIDKDNDDGFLSVTHLQTQLALASLDQARSLRDCCGKKTDPEALQ